MGEYSHRAVMPRSGPRFSGELAEDIIEAMPGGVVHVSTSGRILTANREATRVLGMSYDKLTRRYVEDFRTETFWEDGSPCPPEEYPVTRAIVTGKVQPETTLGIRRPDGELTWAVFRAAPVFSPKDGSVTGAFATFMDITARKRVEEELRKSEARFRSMAESVPAFLMTTDRELTVTFLNRMVPGVDVSAVVGHSALDFIDANDRERVRSRLLRVVHEGRIEAYETRTVDWLGATVYRVTAGPIRYGDEIRGVTMFAEDLSSYKEMEASLLLSDRLTAIGTLVAGVAHEVNNPLTYLLGNLELLRRNEALHALRDRIDDALNGAERIRDVVRDLVSFSHPNSDVITRLRVSEAVDLAERMARHELKRRARVVRDVEPVPDICGSSARLSQVLLNLLLNAAHAIEPGRVDENEIRISTRLLSPERIRISVSDTGKGIDRALVGRIFDPFVTTKPSGQGTGLGLYVCHNIVRSMGGAIWVESEVGKGSTFHIDLPILDSNAMTTEVARVASERAPQGLRILVVDDEPSIRAFLQSSLSAHNVACVNSGADAIVTLDTRSFDLVLCDLMIGDLTGLDIYEHVKATSPQLLKRFVFVTGMTLGELSKKVASLGAPVLQKPFSVEDLERIIARVCNANALSR